MMEQEYNLPKGWLKNPLGEIAKKITKGSTPTTYGYNFLPSGINFIKIENVKNGKINLASIAQFISEEAHKNQARSSLCPGDILFSIAGTIGETAIVEPKHLPANTNQAFAIISGTSDILYPKFLEYQLRSFVSESVKKLARGGAMNNISLENLKEFSVTIAPLNEQKRIVAKIEELFSELDKGIESLKTAREQLKVYRQAVLKYAFEGKLTAKWREKNKDKLESVEQLLRRIQACINNNFASIPREGADLPEIPSEWLYTHLENVGDLGRGKSKHRPRNDKKLFGGQYPFIQTGEIKAANRVVREYSQTYSDFGLQQSKLWPAGTLCITIAANIAETAFLGFDACFPDSVVGFTPKMDLILPEYVELFIESVRVRIEAYAPATAQKNINLTTLENLIIPFCSLEEQREIVRQIEAIFTSIDNSESEIEANLQKSEALRQSILKKAFSGKLVAQDPNDEPACVLLERIRAEREAQEMEGRKLKHNEERRNGFKLAPGEVPVMESLWTTT